MANNAIEVFPEEIAMNGDQRNFNLQKLDISGNPLSCDCHLDWAEKNIKNENFIQFESVWLNRFFSILNKTGSKMCLR